MTQGAKLGDVPLAANHVLYNLMLITSFGLDGLANTAEALIGQAIGRMLSCMLFSFVVYMVAMFTLLPAYDNHALWLALNVFLGFRGLTLMLCYPRLRRELKKPMLSR